MGEKLPGVSSLTYRGMQYQSSLQTSENYEYCILHTADGLGVRRQFTQPQLPRIMQWELCSLLEFLSLERVGRTWEGIVWGEAVAAGAAAVESRPDSSCTLPLLCSCFRYAGGLWAFQYRGRLSTLEEQWSYNEIIKKIFRSSCRFFLRRGVRFGILNCGSYRFGCEWWEKISPQVSSICLVRNSIKERLPKSTIWAGLSTHYPSKKGE